MSFTLYSTKDLGYADEYLELNTYQQFDEVIASIKRRLENDEEDERKITYHVFDNIENEEILTVSSPDELPNNDYDCEYGVYEYNEYDCDRACKDYFDSRDRMLNG